MSNSDLHTIRAFMDRLEAADRQYSEMREKISERYQFSGDVWSALNELLRLYGEIEVTESDIRRAGLSPSEMRRQRLYSDKYDDDTPIVV